MKKIAAFLLMLLLPVALLLLADSYEYLYELFGGGSRETLQLQEAERFISPRNIVAPQGPFDEVKLLEPDWSADVSLGGPVYEPGDPSFALHFLSGGAYGWSEIYKGRKLSYRRISGWQASFMAYLPDAQYDSLEIKAAAGEAPQKLRVLLDETEICSIVIDSNDFKTYRVPIKPGTLKYAYYNVTLEGRGIAVSAMRFALTPAPEKRGRSDFFARIKDGFFGPARKSAILRPGDRLTLQIDVPEESYLAFEYRCEFDGGQIQPLHFSLRATQYDVSAGKFLDYYYLAEDADAACRRGRKSLIDLQAHAGQTLRLEFETSGGQQDERLLIIDPRIIKKQKPELWPEFLKPRNVVVWLSDTLRYDRINALAPGNGMITPNYDLAAERGIVFTRAYAQASWSKPSQAAMLTGRYPQHSNMLEPDDRPTRGTVFMSEAIKRKRPKMTTAEYSANGYVSSAFGFRYDLDYQRNMIRERRANRGEDLLAAWFGVWEKERVYTSPFMVWLGSTDVHVAYNPEREFLNLYDPEPYSGPINPFNTAYLMADISRGRVTLPERDWRHLLALYNGEVSYNDRQFGLMLERLDQWGVLDETAVFIVSDHGEEFLDHGAAGHGHSLYSEIVHVPLIVLYPRGFPEARRIDRPVEMMSIYPTILEMLDIKPPAGIDAESLLPLLTGQEKLSAGPAASFNRKKDASFALGRHRLMLENGRPSRLFDEVSDPADRYDLRESRKDVLYFMLKNAALWMIENRRN